MVMCLGVFLFGSNFFGTLWASWTSWKSICCARLGKFSFIICSNKFSISCCCSSPSGTPMIQILERFRLSQRFLSFSLFFWILVSSFCSGWMFIYSFCSKLVIWFLVSFLSLLVPCRFFFISHNATFIAAWVFFMLQWVSGASWLPVFGTVHVIGWLSLYCLVVFFLELWTVLSYGYFFFFFLVSGSLLHSKGQQPMRLCCGTICGGGVREGAVPLALFPDSFQLLPLWHTNKLGPSGADSWVGGLVYILEPCGSLQWTLLWGWEFLLLLPQPSQVFSIRDLRLYFPALEPWVVRSVSPPPQLFLLVYLQWMWDCLVCQPLPCPPRSSSCLLAMSALCPAACLCPSYRSGWMFLL